MHISLLAPIIISTPYDICLYKLLIARKWSVHTHTHPHTHTHTHTHTYSNTFIHTHSYTLPHYRLGYFIAVGVGAGANILTRYAVSPKFG